MEPPITFSKNEKDIIVHKIKCYLEDELRFDIGTFDAEFLLDFLSEELGLYYYNQRINDAVEMLDSRMEELKESIYVLEKLIPSTK